MQIAIAIVGGLALLAFLVSVLADNEDWLAGGVLVGSLLTIALYVLALVK